MATQFRCMTEGCNNPEIHLTSAHRCENCGEFGHGIQECGKRELMQALKIHENDRFPTSLRCRIEGCRFRHSHKTEAHMCSKCHGNHSAIHCVIQPLENHIEQFGDNGFVWLKTFDYHNFLETYDNVVIDEYAGMGCGLVIRKKHDGIYSMFLDSYSYDVSVYNRFIDGMENITDTYKIIIDSMYPISPESDNDNDNDNDSNDVEMDDIEVAPDYIACPLCRCQVDRNNTKNIKGSSDKCKVCLENDVEVYFMECEHACMCRNCLYKL